MEPADYPGSMTVNVHVALGQEAQNFTMVGSLDAPKFRCTQGGNRNRAGIVGVILVGATGGEHPDTRSQGGRNVEHIFGPGHELLSQQIADPPADSMAQVRFSNGFSQFINCSTWRLVARTLTLES